MNSSLRPPLQLDPKKTALVLIDLQKGIVAMPAVPHSPAEVMERASRLAKIFRSKSALVVYVRVDMSNVLQLPADEPFRDPNAAQPPPSASELAPESGFESRQDSKDILITKRHWGAFAGTELEQVLKQRGINTVVIAGISTNAGVESTVRQGTGLGFAFIIVEDACAARDVDAHRFAMEKTFPRLARVRSTEDVIAALS